MITCWHIVETFVKIYIAAIYERKNSLVVAALSGVAATSISGQTLHSAVHMSIDGKLKQNAKTDSTLINKWEHARMIIVDEISFATKKLIRDLNSNLMYLKQAPNKIYGGLSVVFAGDFFQLEPVNSDVLYKDPSFYQWFEWINAFVELKIAHRYKNDPIWAGIMQRFHDGKLKQSDFDLLDSRVISRNLSDMSHIDQTDVQIACPYNHDRVAMNNAVFLSHLQNTHSKDPSVCPPRHTIVVTSGDMRWRHSKNLLNKNAREILFKQCGDHEVKATTDHDRFVDTILKLFIGAPIMISRNEDVDNGLANGTLCTISQICLKKGITVNKMNIDGYFVNAVSASDVDYLECEMDVKKDGQTMKERFRLKPRDDNCSAFVPLQLDELLPEQKHYVYFTQTQFPVLLNHATTVHKLQGQSRDKMFITSLVYKKNWVYVALSRIRTLNGLFLREKIDRKREKLIPASLA